MEFGNWLPRLRPNFKILKSVWFWIIAWVLLVVIATSVISFLFWDDLKTEDHSSTIRNIVLAAAAIIALPLAIWRSIVAERQADAAQNQFKIAERDLLNERYQKGAEMLGNSRMSVRFGGINALERLGEEHPKDYHLLVMQLFCAFVVEPPENNNGHKNQKENTSIWDRVTAFWLRGCLHKNHKENEDISIPHARQDIQLIIELIGRRNKERRTIESEAGFLLDLSYADLSDIIFLRVDLSNIKFNQSNLSRAKFSSSFFKDVEFTEANLSEAQIRNTNFFRSQFHDTNVSGAKFSDAPPPLKADNPVQSVYVASYGFYKNLSGTLYGAPGCKKSILTQNQLDQAVADPENPPTFEEITDVCTDKPLVWRGKPI